MTRRPPSRAGFTLLETLLVSGLMSLLVLLISAAWAGFGRPTVQTMARCRVAREAALAVAALSGDLGGCLSDPAGRVGTSSQLAVVGRLQPGNNQLWLCFDGGSTPNGTADWAAPDTVIIYQLHGSNLVRWNQTAGTSFTVARQVQDFQVLDQGGGLFEIRLTFAYRGVTRTFTLMARDP